jgi:hypothetical protein
MPYFWANGWQVPAVLWQLFLFFMSFQKRLFVWLGYGLPLGLFFGYLYLFAYNSPEADDYFAIFGFLDDFSKATTFAEKFTVALGLIGEHRIVFSRLLYLGTTWLEGEANLRTFIWLGNLVYLGILPLLYAVFRPSPQKALYFLPVLFFLLQQQYAEITFSAVCSTQHNVVFCFALLTLYTLHRPGKASLVGAALLALLTTFTNANGFIVLPAGLGLLLFTQRWQRAAAWLLPSAIIVFLYFANYQARGGDSGLAFLLANPAVVLGFALKFIGSAIHVSRWGYGLSVGLGAILTVYFVYLLFSGYARKNPVMFGFLLFVALTTVATALGRASMGYAYRYNIYSAFFLVIAYISLVDIFGQKAQRFFRPTIVFGVIFWAFSYFDYTDFILTIRREKTANVYNLSQNGFGLMDRYYSGTYINSGLHFGHKGLLALAGEGLYHFPEPDLAQLKAGLASQLPAAREPLLTATILADGRLEVASTDRFRPTEEAWITLRAAGRAYVLPGAHRKNRLVDFMRTGQYVGPQVSSTLHPGSLPAGTYQLGLLVRAGASFRHLDAGVACELPTR